MGVTKPRGDQVASGTVTDVQEASANKDGLAAVASLRTLGTGSQQACAGNDSRLSDARTPVGTSLTTGNIWLGQSGVAASVAGATALDVLTQKGADIASASTTDLSTVAGQYCNITGTTTITGLGTIAAGARRTCQFAGALTLTHNATSLILPGAANILTSAGDVAEFISLGSGNWICIGFQHAVAPWNGQLVLLATATASSSATVDFTWAAGQTYQAFLLAISNVLAATNAVSMWLRTSPDASTWDTISYSWTNQDYMTGSFSGGDSKIVCAGTTTTLSNSANQDVSGLIWIPDPGATAYGKVHWDLAAVSGSQVRRQAGAGARMNSAAVRGIRVMMSSGNIASGNFRLYGVTRS